VFGQSTADSHITVLLGLVRCLVVKLKYWESVMKLLDDILVCETAVQLWVHTLYGYDDFCYICHVENMEFCSLMVLVYLLQYTSPFY
jgi:hypothetical protein